MESCTIKFPYTVMVGDTIYEEGSGRAIHTFNYNWTFRNEDDLNKFMLKLQRGVYKGVDRGIKTIALEESFA